ncbi:hypothetical protein I4F81_000500 [Pyropia yezoensis]|uniref:Uncharacterized protein n=1 Tax=Pyropia yezoensis TaxID=2788 RepID=A0ACC3BK67_PYRYE|nr:hypothetical protein I4F81_000500 [Neopyropia yezoensis]
MHMILGAVGWALGRGASSAGQHRSPAAARHMRPLGDTPPDPDGPACQVREDSPIWWVSLVRTTVLPATPPPVASITEASAPFVFLVFVLLLLLGCAALFAFPQRHGSGAGVQGVGGVEKGWAPCQFPLPLSVGACMRLPRERERGEGRGGGGGEDASLGERDGRLAAWFACAGNRTQ